MPAAALSGLFILALVLAGAGCSMKKPVPIERPRDVSVKPDIQGGGFGLLSLRQGVAESQGMDMTRQGLNSWRDLEEGVSRSIAYLRTMPRSQYALARPDLALTWGQMTRSAELLRELLPRLDAEPGLLGRRFAWFDLSGGAVMTGYYSPRIEASRTRTKEYRHPVYRTPPDLKRVPVGAASGRRNRWAVYRMGPNGAVPYHARKAIDLDGVLRHRGLEICWLKDPVESWYLHLQGSGGVLFPDGSGATLHYAADNGRPFTSISDVLKDMGLVSRGMSKKEIRAFFRKRPGLMGRVLAANERYIFFRMDKSGNGGHIGRELTPMVSVATDPELLPPGSILALNAPATPMGLAGIGLAQDTGGVIRGRRIDYYVGAGSRAERTALNIRAETRVRLLVSRDILD